MYRLSVGKIKTIKKHLTSTTAAIILAAASLSSATPLFFSHTASAIDNTAYSSVSLSGWATDRTYPSGGYTTPVAYGRPTIQLGIIGADASKSGSFYQTEGIQKTIPASDTITASLYVNATDWTGKNVQAGLWGVGQDSTGAISAYPIVQFNSSVNGWRIWDSAGPTGGWYTASTTYTPNAWNTVELALDKTDNTKTDVYVNGNKIGQSTGDTTTSLNAIILDNFNNGVVGNDYTINWSNILTGLYFPDAPTNLAISHNGSDVTNTVGNNALLSGNVVLNFDAVTGANQYITEVTYPDGTTQDFWNGYHNTWLIKNSVVSQGQFSAKGQGIYSYKVKDRNASTGLWSNWSTPVSLGYDTTKPTAAFTSTTSYPTPNGFYNSDFSVGYLVHDNVMLKSVNVALFDTDPSHSNHWVANCYSNGTVGSNTATGTCTVHIPATTPDGIYYVQIGGQDMAGYWTVNATRSITIDRTAPDVPTNLSWKTTGKVVVPNNGTTNEYSGTASWQDSSSDVNHYIYKYWNDISGNQYKVGTEYLATVNGTSLSGVFNQGEGVHHFCVEAVDNAGNTSACSAPFTITYDATVITDNFTVNMLTGDKVTLAPTVTSQTGPLTYTWTVSNPKLLNYPQDTKTGSALVIGPAPKDTYTVTLTVQDRYGYQTVATYAVTISDHASVTSTTATNNPTPSPKVLGDTTVRTTTAPSNDTAANDGEVLGAQTTTPSQNAGTTNASTTSGSAAPSNVETLTTNKPDTINHSRFLLLGWWWLVVVAALVGFFWLLLGRHSDHDAQ